MVVAVLDATAADRSGRPLGARPGRSRGRPAVTTGTGDLARPGGGEQGRRAPAPTQVLVRWPRWPTAVDRLRGRRTGRRRRTRRASTSPSRRPPVEGWTRWWTAVRGPPARGPALLPRGHGDRRARGASGWPSWCASSCWPRARDELPHSIACRVTEWEWPRIRCEILVERDSQKGIVIGQGGEVLKAVGTAVRAQLPPGAFLELFVRVEKHWQQRDDALDRLGLLRPGRPADRSVQRGSLSDPVRGTPPPVAVRW